MEYILSWIVAGLISFALALQVVPTVERHSSKGWGIFLPAALVLFWPVTFITVCVIALIHLAQWTWEVGTDGEANNQTAGEALHGRVRDT